MEFFRVWPSTPAPEKSARTLNSFVSARGYRFCEPLLAAANHGWLLYPPTDFNLLWDGVSSFIQFPDADEWIKIDRIFLPHFSEMWCKHLPKKMHALMPVFVEAFPERHVLQVWSGMFAKTPPGYSLWVRSPINRNSEANLRIIEGVIETDWWAGPLFTNFEWIKSDHPVSFKRDLPFLQVIPLCRNDAIDVYDLHNFFEEAPENYMQDMITTHDRRNSEPPGSYRKKSKQKRAARNQDT